MRRAFTVMETVILLVGLVVVGVVGSSFQRRLLAQAELLRYRAAMGELAMTVRSMQVQASTQHRTFELRVDATQKRLQMVEIRQTPGGVVETVRQTVWLPAGLEVSEAPAVLTLQVGERASLVIAAPAYNRLFHLMASRSGGVQLHEEQTL